MVAHSNKADFKKVSLNDLRWWIGQLKQDERVTFNIGDQLFLLLENILKVRDILIRVLLVLEFFD